MVLIFVKELFVFPACQPGLSLDRVPSFTIIVEYFTSVARVLVLAHLSNDCQSLENKRSVSCNGINIVSYLYAEVEKDIRSDDEDEEEEVQEKKNK